MSVAATDLIVNLSSSDLRGEDYSGADLRNTNASHSNLSGVALSEADLSGAEFMGADLSNTDLSQAQLVNTGLGHACLNGARAFGANLSGASLQAASLKGADLRRATLEGARLSNTDLREVNFTGANLRNADLSGCNVHGATFRDADLRGARLRGTQGYNQADWVHADMRSVDFNGAWLLRRFAIDQNFLEEFRRDSTANAWLFHLWSITSDCGRSLGRWAFWTCLIAVLYALGYAQLAIDYGDHQTWLSPLYFSVVTLTTLGFGDALPTTVASQIAVIAQVLTGYVMLGGLLSIFAAKMGRRGG